MPFIPLRPSSRAPFLACLPSRRSPFNSARVHRLHLTVPIQRQAHLSFRSSLGSICLVFRLPRAILCDESSSSANLHRPFLFHTF
ncbi:unnamed protein product [Closterium sp. NIES-65]|nr:unnamed protein product [Closterium sp. NIES-65]